MSLSPWDCNPKTVDELVALLYKATGLSEEALRSLIQTRGLDIEEHTHLSRPYIMAIIRILLGLKPGLSYEEFLKELSLIELKKKLPHMEFVGLVVFFMGERIPLDGYYTPSISDEEISVREASQKGQPKGYSFKKEVVAEDDLRYTNLLACRYDKDGRVTNCYSIDEITLETIRKDFSTPPRNNMVVPPFAFVDRMIDNFLNEKEPSERFLSLEKPAKSEFERGFFVRLYFKKL